MGCFLKNERTEFESLKNESITYQMVKESAKKNNFESLIGFNLLNKLGIFLIIIGVIVASQYTYLRLSDVLKGFMMFGFGGIMILVGEILSRKNRMDKVNIFSLGVTAGGVAILYVALAASYFRFGILDMYPALIICVLITAGAFVLATQHSTQVILSFALIGGYLPMFSINNSQVMVYGAMIYFVVLNLLALIISFHKKWTVSTMIGLFLNIVGTIYIIMQIFSYPKVKYGVDINVMITIAYVLFAFLIYTFIPIIGIYKAKLKFKKWDVALIAINTFISSIAMYVVFAIYDLNEFNGALAIIFAITYFVLAKLIQIKFISEKNMRALFYLTGFVFVVLIIPFQFDIIWLSQGWLVEGVFLTTYGILKNNKDFKRNGFIIEGLCVWAFLIIDFLGGMEYQFAYKYLVIINLWFYSIYVITSKLQERLHFDTMNDNYICNVLAIAVTFLIAGIAPRIRILCDRGIKVIAIGMYCVVILWLTVLQSVVLPIKGSFSQVPMAYAVYCDEC